MVCGLYFLVSFIHSTHACTSDFFRLAIVRVLKNGLIAWLSMLRYCRTLELSRPRVVAQRSNSATTSSVPRLGSMYVPVSSSRAIFVWNASASTFLRKLFCRWFLAGSYQNTV